MNEAAGGEMAQNKVVYLLCLSLIIIEEEQRVAQSGVLSCGELPQHYHHVTVIPPGKLDFDNLSESNLSLFANRNH